VTHAPDPERRVRRSLAARVALGLAIAAIAASVLGSVLIVLRSM
jgi:hypothetical protein